MGGLAAGGNGFRRILAALAGALLLLAAIPYFVMWSSVLFMDLIAPETVSVVRNCVEGYRCPGEVELMVADTVFGLAPTVAVFLTVAGAYGLLRYATGVSAGLARWAPAAAVAGPVLAIATFAATFAYGGSIGAFS